MASSAAQLNFSGKDTEDVTELLQAIQRAAFAEGRQRDNDWRVDLLETSLIGEALRWDSNLEEEEQYSWVTLRRKLIERFDPRYGRHTAPEPPAAAPVPRHAVPGPPAAAAPVALQYTASEPLAVGSSSKRIVLPGSSPPGAGPSSGQSSSTTGARLATATSQTGYLKIVKLDGTRVGYVPRSFAPRGELSTTKDGAATFRVPIPQGSSTSPFLIEVIVSLYALPAVYH